MADTAELTPPANAEEDNAVDLPLDDDKTQPTEEHLQALQALESMPNSQDTDIIDPGPSSQPEDPPVTPPSPFSSVRERVQAKPTDVDSWHTLIQLAEDSGDYEKTTSTYEAVLEVFPNTVRATGSSPYMSTE